MLFTLLFLAAEGGASAGASLPELPVPAQYGLLGIGFAAVVSGRFLVPRYVLDRERNDRMEALTREQERADRAEERASRNEEESRRLNTVIQDKFVPAIVDASNAVRDATLLIHEIKREREIEREILDRQRGGPK